VRGQRLSIAHQSGHLLDAPRSDVSTEQDRQLTERLEREATLLEYDADFPDRDLRLRAYAGISLRTERRVRTRAMGTSIERDRVLAYHAGASLTLVPWSDASLELGADAVLEDVGSGADTFDAATLAVSRGRGRYVDDSRYDTYALYALWSQALSARWTALAGARGTLVYARAPVDPLFEASIGEQRRLDRTLPGAVASLGVRWDATESLSWTASLLGGYRPPNLEDFQALGGGARGFTVPNPELDEERSWTLETGAKLEDGRWEAMAYVFASRLTGLIERVPSAINGMAEIDGARVQTPANASRSVLLGAELALVHRLPMGLYGGVAAHGTWGETVRPDADGLDVTEPASKVPPPTASLQLGFAPDSAFYWVHGVVALALPQPRLSENDKNDVRVCEQGPEGCDEEPGYVDLSVRAGVRLLPWITIAAGVENLLDHGYKTFASGAFAPGRNVTLALRGSI
jgi:outer membrane receptor protein involved in Fe transport